MSTRRSSFRPSVQALENRRLMAGDVGLVDASLQKVEEGTDRVEATVQQVDEASQKVTIVDSTLSGNSASPAGTQWLEVFTCPDDGLAEARGADADEVFSAMGRNEAAYKVAEIDILSWSWGETNDS